MGTRDSAAAADPSAPLLAGRYRYDGELGRGASARVIGLVDTTDGTRLAAKLLDAQAGARAGWELAVLQRVESPHLTRVRELLRVEQPLPNPLGIARGTWVLVESRAAGVPSVELLRDTADDTLRGARLEDLVVDVARALDALHARGLAHGDVKPDNVVADVRGDSVRATLLDLGGASSFGRSGTLSGTPAFMAPEALEGDRSRATDLFSLGASIFAWSGASDEALFDSVRMGSVPELPAWVPARLATLARQLVATRIADRPTDVVARLRPDGEGASSIRALCLPAPRVGVDVAFDQLVALLQTTTLLDVVGPSGSGRTRLVEDAVREVQARLAERGDEVPTYWRGAELPWEIRGAAFVHVENADASVDGASLERFLQAGRIAGARRVVIFERSPSERPAAIRVPALVVDETRALLGHLVGHPVAAAVAEAAHVASQGLAGRLVRGAETLVRSGLDPERAVDWKDAAWVGREELPRTGRVRAFFELVSAVGGVLELDRPLEALDLAESARWAIAEGLAVLDPSGALALRPDLVRPPEPRARRRLAREALALGARGPSRAVALAWVGDDAEAEALVLRLLDAAREARAPERARALAERFARHTPSTSARLVVAWADAARAGGEPHEALAILREGRSSARARMLEAEVARTVGDLEHAKRALALASAEQADDPTRAELEALGVRLALAAGAPVPTDVDALVDRAAQHPGIGAARAAECAVLIALARHPGSERDERDGDARHDAARAIERGRALLDRPEAASAPAWERAAWRARFASYEALVASRDGDLGAARRAHEASASAAHASGERLLEATFDVNCGLARLDDGDLVAALDALELGARTLARLGRTRELGRVLANLANARLLAGDDARARALLDEALPTCRRADDADGLALVAILQSELALQHGKIRAALSALEEAPRESVFATTIGARRAQLLALLGELEGAQRALDATSTPSAPRDAAERALAQARVFAARQQVDDALRALAPHRSAALPFELRVRVLATLADLHDGRGERSEAAAALTALRGLLEPALRALPSDLQARFRQVPTHLRALNEGRALPEGRRASGSEDTRAVAVALEGVVRIVQASTLRGQCEALATVALEVSAAERAFVVAWGRDGASVISRAGTADPSARPSTSLVARALREGCVVTSDAQIEGDAGASVHALALRSVLAIRVATAPAVSEPVVVVVDDRLRPHAFDDAVKSALSRVASVVAAHWAVQREARLARRRARDAERGVKRSVAREAELESVAAAQREKLRALAPSEDAFAPFVHRELGSARLVAQARRLASSTLSVLLVGETGVGKDVLARAIHFESPRRDGPFVAESAGALDGDLLESTLFGHVRGAFTGADRARRGLFELADGGTLYLDAVDDLPPSVQAKLLRVLVEGEVRPLGGERARRVDVRLVAAMRSDPHEAIASGRLREDLYYRLAGAELVIPPLRERPADLDAIVTAALARRHATLSPDARRALHAYTWPGNVRELEHALERGSLAATSGTISAAALGLPASTREASQSLHDQRGALTRELVLAALAAHGNNRTRAARALGVSRFGLQKMLARWSRADDEAQGDPPAK